MSLLGKRFVGGLVALGASGLLLAGCVEEEEAKELTILISGPISLTEKYAQTCNKVISGASAAIEWVNEVQGGISLPDNTTGKLKLEYVDDESGVNDPEAVANLTQAACDDENVHFLLAPYSSGLTAKALEVANSCGKLLLDHGGASNSLFVAGNKIAASIAPASNYHRSILDAVKNSAGDVSALDVSFFYELGAFTESVQAAAVEYATAEGFNVVDNMNYPAGAATSTDFADVMAAVEASPPDVLLGGGHAGDGQTLTRLLYGDGTAPVEPNAFSLLVAPTDPDFYDLVVSCPAPCDYASHPAEGVSGPSHWEVGVGFTQESAAAAGANWYGPSQQDFLTVYEKYAGAGAVPSYHAANGAAMILALTQAITNAQSVETGPVQSALQDLNFMSFWGMWDIDETGANVGHEMVEVQWINGEKQIVWPEAGKTADFVYPIN